MVIQAKKQSKQNEVLQQSKNCPKDISIDPKTWVKLGHFHLLLEDYRKGLQFQGNAYISAILFNLQLCLPIKCFTKHKRKIIGWILLFFMDLERCTSIIMLSNGMSFLKLSGSFFPEFSHHILCLIFLAYQLLLHF